MYPSKWIFCFLWDFSFSFCYCLVVFYPNTGIFCDNSSIYFLCRITLCFNREAVMILRPSIKGIYNQKCPFVAYHIWWYLFLSPIWLLFTRWIGFLKHNFFLSFLDTDMGHVLEIVALEIQIVKASVAMALAQFSANIHVWAGGRIRYWPW